MAFPLRMVPAMGRSCGDCTECCHSIGVEELKKGIWEPCQHVSKTGCTNYGDRPESCRTFECLWLQGALEGDERRRPDNLGLMFTVIQDSKIGALIGCWEVREGALKSQQGQYVLDKLRRRFGIYIWPHKEAKKRSVMGPPELFEKISGLVERDNLGQIVTQTQFV